MKDSAALDDTVRGAERERLDHLTGLRGVAAYSVLLAHATDSTMAGTPLLTPGLAGAAEELAYFGMSLFFVLSGFVIHYNYAEVFKDRPFYEAARFFFSARFARLYPLYFLAILLTTLYSASPIFIGRPGAATAYLTMTASWFNLEQLVYPPSWSISTEWFFYFAFAALAPFLSRSKINPLWQLLATIVLVPAAILLIHSQRAIVYPLIASAFWHDNNSSADVFTWLWYYAPVIRLGEFLSGMFASAVWLHFGCKLPLNRHSSRTLELAALTWCLLLILVGGAFGGSPVGILSTNFAFAPAITVILLTSANARSPLGRILRSRILIVAGDISYSVYIFQWWAKLTMNGFFTEHSFTLYGYYTVALKILGIAFVSTIMAYGSYHLYEYPARRITRSALIGSDSSSSKLSKERLSMQSSIKAVAAIAIVLISFYSTLKFLDYWKGPQSPNGTTEHASEPDAQPPTFDSASLPHLAKGQVLTFTTSQARAAFISGWIKQNDGAWSGAHTAYFGVNMDRDITSKSIVISISANIVPGKLDQQSVDVWSQGDKLANFTVKGNTDLNIPLDGINAPGRSPLILTFHFPNAVSPSALGIASGNEPMAIYVRAIQLL